MKLCIDCSKECKPESLRCIPCANLKHREQTKKLNKEKKKTKKTYDKICEECKELYKALLSKQRFCSERCRKKNEIDCSNSKWIVREERKPNVKLNKILENEKLRG